MAVSPTDARGLTAIQHAPSLFRSARAANPFATFLASGSPASGDQTSGEPTGVGLADAVQSAESAELADLKRNAASALSEFNRTLRQLFADSGVDVSPEVRLESNGRGGVVVAGQHPDSDKVEQVFADNPDLAEKFHALERMYGRIRNLEADAAPGAPLFAPVFNLSFIEDDVRVSYE